MPVLMGLSALVAFNQHSYFRSHGKIAGNLISRLIFASDSGKHSGQAHTRSPRHSLCLILALEISHNSQSLRSHSRHAWWTVLPCAHALAGEQAVSSPRNFANAFTRCARVGNAFLTFWRGFGFVITSLLFKILRLKRNCVYEKRCTPTHESSPSPKS
jgi:hypothetical protein